MRTVIPLFILAIALCIIAFTFTGEAEGLGPVPNADPSRVGKDIRYLASDELEGRRVTTPGAEKAALYIAKSLEESGLQPGDTVNGDYYQEFEIPEGVPISGYKPELANAGPSPSIDLVLENRKTSNVVGIIPGSDPMLSHEWVIIGAHYDHLGIVTDQSGVTQIYNGADDNASGVAGILEVARMFKDSGIKPLRSILFISFTGEEFGAIGSSYYIQNPLVPMADTVAMINLDMVGRIRTGENGVLTCSIDGLGDAREWSEIVPKISPDTKIEFNLLQNPLVGGDYIPFLQAKVPTLNFFSGVHENYHQPSDDADLINFDGEASMLGGVFQTLVNTTNYPGRLTFMETMTPSKPPSGMPSYKVYLGTIPDFSKTDGGFWISGVAPGSPAEAAGLLGGDQILMVGEFPITSIYDYTNALGAFEPGDAAEIIVSRNGEEMHFTVTFASRDQSGNGHAGKPE
jgi:hypothetical protein